MAGLGDIDGDGYSDFAAGAPGVEIDSITIPADSTLDLASSHLRIVLEGVKETTGYEVGSVPPFHWQPRGFRSFLDVELLRYDVLGVDISEINIEDAHNMTEGIVG